MRRTLTILILVGLLIVAFALHNLYVPVETDRSSVAFTIENGATFRDIAKDLEKSELIRSIFLFKLYAKVKNADSNIKAGRYFIDPMLSPARLLSFLQNPDHGELLLTIPEGFTIREIDKRLTDQALIEHGSFIEATQTFDRSSFDYLPEKPLPIDGYLFPESYLVFADDFSSEDLISKMLETYEDRVLKGLQKDLSESTHTLHEIITMASLIEKEVQTANDMRLVSGILWKRLENDWPLQADATLLYIKSDRTITTDDLTGDSPYNTRNRRGLPPTPIANPGLNAILAALNPESSPYWFYLTGSDGVTHFAVSNEEHNSNKKYL
jgi:UPF0755 protein